MQKLLNSLLLTVLLVVISTFSASAQFEEPEIERIDPDQKTWFMNKFEDVKWTGQGFYGRTELDERQTNEIRARLQEVFGDPTKTIEDLITQPDFRPAQAIQFEYWFVVDDSIPMMLLDIDGPFGRGLVYAGASKYIDLMPEVKRTLSKELMAIKRDSLPDYEDYYYAPERRKWFEVSLQEGQYRTKEISSPIN